MSAKGLKTIYKKYRPHEVRDFLEMEYLQGRSRRASVKKLHHKVHLSIPQLVFPLTTMFLVNAVKT